MTCATQNHNVFRSLIPQVRIAGMVNRHLARLRGDKAKSKVAEAGSLALRDELVLDLALANDKFANLYKGELAVVPSFTVRVKR